MTDRPGKSNKGDVNGLSHKTPAELEQGLFVQKAVRTERERPTFPVSQGPQEREGEAEGDSLELALQQDSPGLRRKAAMGL